MFGHGCFFMWNSPLLPVVDTSCRRKSWTFFRSRLKNADRIVSSEVPIQLNSYFYDDWSAIRQGHTCLRCPVLSCFPCFNLSLAPGEGACLVCFGRRAVEEIEGTGAVRRRRFILAGQSNPASPNTGKVRGSGRGAGD